MKKQNQGQVLAELSIDDVRPILEKGIANGKNVLMVSVPGTGKTSITMDVIKSLGMECGYLSVPTLDPWVDLVGIPKEKDGYLEFVRKKISDKIEVLVLDEFNATSHYKTLNALKELLIFKTINGVPYKSLKSIVGLMNPPDNQHSLFELDDAVMDRFHIKVALKNVPTAEQLQKVGVPEKISSLIIRWNTSLGNKYSARSLDYAFQLCSIGVDPICYFGDMNDSSTFLAMLENGDSPFYEIGDFMSGKVLSDLKANPRKISVAVADCVTKIKAPDGFWTKETFLGVYALLSQESRATVYSLLKGKFMHSSVWEDVKKELNKIEQEKFKK